MHIVLSVDPYLKPRTKSVDSPSDLFRKESENILKDHWPAYFVRLFYEYAMKFTSIWLTIWVYGT